MKAVNIRVFRIRAPLIVVETSFWPVLVSLRLFSLLRNTVLYLNLKLSFFSVLLRIIFLVLLRLLWWKDFIRERILGYHTHKLELCLRSGIIFFILSEVFFFIRFFWAFYDSALAPVIELGIIWPPKGIVVLSVYSVPLLNTIILLRRGITVTWAHHALINNFFIKVVFSLGLTVLLGIYFLIIQWVEYNEASFRIADRVYGSTFFFSNWFSWYACYCRYNFFVLCFFKISLR